MAQTMRLLAGLLFVLLMATVAMAQQVEPVKPIGAWCGGSYSPIAGLEPKDYVEAVKAGQALGSGTNFGSCDDVVKEVRGLDGKVTEIRIPTYPAAPSSQVSFEADGRILYRNGDVDKAGNAVVLELKLPEIPR
jgi:hypothetical protein